jgi:hypothetical protein
LLCPGRPDPGAAGPNSGRSRAPLPWPQ